MNGEIPENYENQENNVGSNVQPTQPPQGPTNNVPGYYAQQNYPPPAPKKTNTGLIVGIAVAVVAIIVIAVVFMAFLMGSPLVGKWHIVKEGTSGHLEDVSSQGEYITFWGNGTGKTEQHGTTSYFKWHDNGNGNVSLTSKEGSTEITIYAHYKVTGNKLTLTIKMYGEEYITIAEKV